MDFVFVLLLNKTEGQSSKAITGNQGQTVL